ncbi:MAG: IS1634 family transposase, partial [Thermoplasmata archaeon]
IYGAMIVAFLAQLFISLIRFEHKELKHTSPKFIKISLMNLTVTVEFEKTNKKSTFFPTLTRYLGLFWTKNV